MGNASIAAILARASTILPDAAQSHVHLGARSASFPDETEHCPLRLFGAILGPSNISRSLECVLCLRHNHSLTMGPRGISTDLAKTRGRFRLAAGAPLSLVTRMFRILRGLPKDRI